VFNLNTTTGQAQAQPGSMPSALIRLVGLSKSYSEGNNTRQVLQNVTVDFPKGEFSAIVGKSGSGKSTLLNLISGIDRADAGEVHIGDYELTGLNEQSLTYFRRQNIGFIFQFFNLISTLTVWENLTLPLELNGLMDASGRQRAEAMLAEVELLDRAKTYPDRLSGGEQQRIAIARALSLIRKCRLHIRRNSMQELHN